LVRAADSIGANIAEANGRAKGPDQSRLLVIARGSIYETQHWLERARSRGLA
jgi:four helix bundle protein